MFTIGEFSRLCCISARTLRHYDAIGLLHPIASGKENSYRYYDSSQLPGIQKIEHLKQYDFTLEEIKHLLTLSDAELADCYRRQLPLLRKKRQHYDALIHQMEAEISHKEDSAMNDYHVITMTQKSQHVLAIRRTISLCSEAFHKLSKELHQQLQTRGLSQTGPLQICYLDEEFNEDSATVELQIEVNETGEGIKQLPGGLFVTTIHTGDLAHISSAYHAILSWLSKHPEYEICGPSIERLLIDESMAASREALQTAVLFPIHLK